MSAVDIAFPLLRSEEGFRALPYKDSNGLLTVGYGFCISRGISKKVAAALLLAQETEVHESMMEFEWYAALDPVRQSVCINIGINEGVGGLLKFPKMIAALEAKDWKTAAGECSVKNVSLRQRYATLAQILLTGVSP